MLGEACHHIDFCLWLIGSPVVDFDVRCFGGNGGGYLREDNVHIDIAFADGSLTALQYVSNGAKAFPTEVVEVTCENQSARLVDFRTLDIGKGMRSRRRRWWGGDTKGHRAQLRSFLGAITSAKSVDTAGYLISSQLVIAINERLSQYLVRDTRRTMPHAEDGSNIDD